MQISSEENLVIWGSKEEYFSQVIRDRGNANPYEATIYEIEGIEPEYYELEEEEDAE